MNDFEFCTPTDYIFGRGVEDRVGALCAERLARKVLIVYGGGSAERSGLLARVRRSLEAAGVEFGELGGIRPNPEDSPVRRGIDMCRREGYGALLAVGGGSVIDTAKAIAGGVPYDGDFWDFWAGKAVMTDALPVGVILTIAAAGSEGSGNSVITNTACGHKISLRTQVLRPRFAILDPELTVTLPPYQTACGITDMMAHILERYFTNTTDCEVTDRLCEGLLRAIIDTAPRVMAEPTDYQARANIMWAGTMAHNGICGVGRQEEWSCHAIEHEISALYPHVAHGAGLAAVFPAWMEYVAQYNPGRVEQLGRRVFDVESSTATVAALRGFFTSLGMPSDFAGLGIPHPDIDRMVAGLHQVKGDPFGFYHPLTPRDTSAIYNLLQS